MDASEEIRCPNEPRKMFAKVTGDAVTVAPGNLIEVACPHCRRRLRAAGQDVDLVLHRYNLLAEHVETEIL